MKKVLALALSLALAVAIGIGGTLAWLTDMDTVTNTFTVGNIDIALDETKTDFKMVPGQTIAKDPLVTVKGGSEACWLFVKIEKGGDLDNFISYGVATGTTETTGWTVLDARNHPGVYYLQVPADANDQSFGVLKDNKVTVLETVTKEAASASPTLTFTAYAVQQAGFKNALKAWDQAQSAATPSTP